MPIKFRCSVCGKLLRVPDAVAGRQAKCPACGHVIPVPSVSSGGQPTAQPPSAGPGQWQPPADQGGYPAAGLGADSAAGGGADMPAWGNAGTPRWTPPPAGPPPSWTAASAGPPPGMPGGFPPATPYGSAQQYMATSRVSAPATWLIVLAILDIAFCVILLPLFFLGLFGAGVAAGEEGPRDEFLELFLNLSFNTFNLLIGLACAIVVLLGAIRMKNLQSYGLAMTAAILSIIPCTSPCCFLIGTPIGIWALVVLNDPAVKSTFR